MPIKFEAKPLGKIMLTAPGPTVGQMFRDLPYARKSPEQFLVNMYQKYGDVVQFPLPILPVYLVVNPEDVDRVLRVNAKNYGKRTIQYENLAEVTGEGLLAADTEPWKRQRKLIQPAFHHEAIMRVGPDTALVTARMLEAWKHKPAGSIVDIDDDMMHAALEIVSRSLFGTDLAGDVEKTAEATLDALDVIVARARTPIKFPEWLPTPNNQKMSKALKQLNGAVSRILKERASDNLKPGVEREIDMLDLLIAAHDAEDVLSDDELRDQIVTFLVAGHETVASSLTWTWWLLAANPEKQKAVIEEVDRVLAARTPTIKDVNDLVYTKAVVDEALRIFPPGWVVSRRALGEDVLGGYEIPKDAVIIISPWATHRHPSAWEDGMKFSPERFLPEAASPKKGTYLPFGIGPRQCIGKDFALLESALLIAQVLQKYRVEPVTGTPEVRAAVMARPKGGLPMKIYPR
ncbi:MAG: cytochrome P450 [Candidatus Nanopelagicales bacterium]